MDKLKAMRFFCTIEEVGSFSAAARIEKVPVSTLSRSLQALETELGAELLNRSTRHVALTEIGKIYLSQCKDILSAVERAEGQVGSYHSRPAGILRISALPLYAELRLLPILEKFQTTYPDIVLDLDLSNHVTDLNRDGVDIAIRGGRAPDERIIAQALEDNTSILIASKQYVDRYGRPETVRDLTEHRALVYRAPTQPLHWHFESEGTWLRVDIPTAMITNGGQLIRHALISGQGLGLLPRWSVATELASGELMEIELDATLSIAAAHPRNYVYLLYQRPQYEIPKIKMAVDFFQSHLGSVRL